MADVRPLLRTELLPPKSSARRHMISIADLTREDVERLLALSRTFARSLERDVKKLPTLRGRTVVNLFFESSTRTSSSFELAAKRLSADVMSIKASGSAVDKGESLKDTLLTRSSSATRRSARRTSLSATRPRTWSTPVTASTSIPRRRSSTSTRSTRSWAGSRGSTSPSSATCSTPASPARTSRRSCSWVRG